MTLLFGKTVAVIDDEPMVTLILVEFFAEHGANVIEIEKEDDIHFRINSLIGRVDFFIFSVSHKSTIEKFNHACHGLKQEHPEILAYLFSNQADKNLELPYQKIFTRPFDPEAVVKQILNDLKGGNASLKP